MVRIARSGPQSCLIVQLGGSWSGIDGDLYDASLKWRDGGFPRCRLAVDRCHGRPGALEVSERSWWTSSSAARCSLSALKTEISKQLHPGAKR